MVLWVCAVCFSKSRTKDEEQQVHEEAKREQRAHQADAAVALPDVTNAPSEPGKVAFHSLSSYVARNAAVAWLCSHRYMMRQFRWAAGTATSRHLWCHTKLHVELSGIAARFPPACGREFLEIQLYSVFATPLTRTAAAGPIPDEP